MPTSQPDRPQQSIQDRIAGDLRAAIADGVYPVGTPVPSEEKLIGMHGAARGTIRRALRLLVDEGLIVNRPRRGYYVTSSLTATWNLDNRITLDAVPEAPITVSTAEPGDQVGGYGVGELLGLDADDLAVARTRTVTDTGGTVLGVVADYVSFAIARDTVLMRKQPADILAEVAAVAAARPPSGPPLDELHIRAATPGETDLLGLPPAALLLEQTRRLVFQPDARCLVVGHALYRTGPGINFLYGGT